ncbi:MAG: DUF2695 domain-containing protein [Propionibacteriaceae bacterium]|nr:DUF2695 domain-containing protein [Propionibacteriaceae bacterium]
MTINTRRPDSADTVVRVAEEILSTASMAVLGPSGRECLLCYVQRMVATHGCDTTLRFAQHFRAVRAPRATALERRLISKGGFCDCEIFLNAYDVSPEVWSPEIVRTYDCCGVQMLEQAPLPSCYGVRTGSTQPCPVWAPRLRGWW